MKIAWFDAEAADKFGRELAEFLIEKLSAGELRAVGKLSAKKKDVVGKLVYKTEQFKRQNSLNFYKKAKFGNAFQWTLKDAGYDEVFINELTKELLLKL